MASRKPGPGGARPGAGRKPKPAHERRRNRLVLYLTDAELEELEGAIGDEQYNEYVRDVLFRHLAHRRRRRT